jgi:tetratricopeptide (TPR) repeat protein
MSPHAAAGWVAGLLLLAGAAHLAVGAPGLVEGNRHFRAGRLDAAIAAYAAGWRVSREPALAYNLGTAAHQLGRLPEAVLWYRRAAVALPADPWLRDNLALARQALGPPAVPAPGPRALLAAQRDRLRWAGVALVWAALPLALLRGRAARRGFALAALLGAAAFATGTWLAYAGPQPAVLLDDCAPELPAGAEVWVEPAGDGFRVLGAPGDRRCPAGTVGRVTPPRR